MKALLIGLFLLAAPPAFAACETAYCKLDSRSQQSVRESFNLARSLYARGRYQHCLEELSRMQDIVDTFEDSEELHSSCLQGLELVMREQSKIQRRTAGQDKID